MTLYATSLSLLPPPLYLLHPPLNHLSNNFSQYIRRPDTSTHPFVHLLHLDSPDSETMWLKGLLRKQLRRLSSSGCKHSSGLGPLVAQLHPDVERKWATGAVRHARQQRHVLACLKPKTPGQPTEVNMLRLASQEIQLPHETFTAALQFLTPGAYETRRLQPHLRFSRIRYRGTRHSCTTAPCACTIRGL